MYGEDLGVTILEFEAFCRNYYVCDHGKLAVVLTYLVVDALSTLEWCLPLEKTHYRIQTLN